MRSITSLPVQLVDLEQTVYERFLECMDNIERAVLDPALSKKSPSSRIFFHVLSPLVSPWTPLLAACCCTSLFFTGQRELKGTPARSTGRLH